MRFSIITVCYNSEKTIKRTIDAMLAQTYQDYEYIIVDGNSKDQTVQFIKDAEPLFNGRLRWISEPDSGIYNAMNKGIAMATGDIVGIINSDDWYSPEALESVANAIKNVDMTNAVITGDMRFHYNSGKTGIYEVSEKGLIDRLKNLQMCVNHPSTFVPKIIYDTFGGFDESIKLAADADLMFRLAFNGVKFKVLNKVLANMAEGGMTTSNNSVILNDRRIIYQKYVTSNLERSVRMTKTYLRYFVKGFVPRWLINYVRQKRTANE